MYQKFTWEFKICAELPTVNTVIKQQASQNYTLY